MFYIIYLPNVYNMYSGLFVDQDLCGYLQSEFALITHDDWAKLSGKMYDRHGVAICGGCQRWTPAQMCPNGVTTLKTLAQHPLDVNCLSTNSRF